jgi:hypothetical protein
VDVRRVAREEHPADPEPLGQAQVGPPHRAPGEVAQPHACREAVDERLQPGQGRLAVEGCAELELVGARQRAEHDAGARVGGAAEPVDVLAVEPVGGDVAEQHLDALVGDPGERHAQRLAHGAAPAVGADQPGRAHGLAGGQRGRDAVVVLGEADQAHAELHRDAQLGEA